MLNFRDLLDTCKAEAIANTLVTTEVSVWREMCRTYSKTFHTPLHLVLNMAPEEVALAVFEEQLNDFDDEKHLETILDQIYTLEDPEYEDEKESQVDEFIEQARKDEEERLRLGKPIHRAMKNEDVLPGIAEPPIAPEKSSGFLNLAYLAKEEEDQEGGFD